MFGEVLLVVQSDDEVAVFLVSGEVALEVTAVFDRGQGLFGMLLRVPQLDFVPFVFVDTVQGKPLSCFA